MTSSRQMLVVLHVGQVPNVRPGLHSTCSTQGYYMYTVQKDVAQGSTGLG